MMFERVSVVALAVAATILVPAGRRARIFAILENCPELCTPTQEKKAGKTAQ